MGVASNWKTLNGAHSLSEAPSKSPLLATLLVIGVGVAVDVVVVVVVVVVV